MSLIWASRRQRHITVVFFQHSQVAFCVDIVYSHPRRAKHIKSHISDPDLPIHISTQTSETFCVCNMCDTETHQDTLPLEGLQHLLQQRLLKHFTKTSLRQLLTPNLHVYGLQTINIPQFLGVGLPVPPPAQFSMPMISLSAHIHHADPFPTFPQFLKPTSVYLFL